MMQPELLQLPSWQFYNIIHSTCDHVGAYGGQQMDGQFLPILSNEFSSGISSDQFLSTESSSVFLEDPNSQMDNIVDAMEGMESIMGSDIENVCRWLEEDASEETFPSSIDDDVWSPCQSSKSSEASLGFPSVQASLTLPRDDMEIDSQLRTQHLLKAYGEAMEMEQRELAEVIGKCIIEKVNPVGDTLERIASNLFQSAGKEREYLKQESSKNSDAAFKALYQIFPYGRFAHFTANLAILEAMPDYIETVHIVDFDMREGVQWPPMIEAIAQQQKALKITSIKTGEDCGDAPLCWRFEETKRRLYDHARSFGLNLKVEEVGIEDLVGEVKKIKKRGEGREWLAFNCMVGLPHMGRERSRSHVRKFLGVAKELLADSAATNRGILTMGDGDAIERLRSCSSYGSFFDMSLNHYQALCESMEWNFPACLAEARIAMENLFVAPFISSLSWLRKWEEVREGSDLHAEMGFADLRMTKENLMEAEEMVKEGESLFTVRIEAHKQNEMVLEWRGTPLVRVSTWR